MGCGDSKADQPSSKILDLEPKMINAYIDKLPLYLIQKIKQKFDNYCNSKFELEESQFKVLHRPSLKNLQGSGSIILEVSAPAQDSKDALLGRMFQFYTDPQGKNLNFKKFIYRYAILNKCEPEILASIIVFLHTREPNSKRIGRKQYEDFVKAERKHFSFEPTPVEDPSIANSRFYELLRQSGFLWEEYRKIFSLIDKEDITFEMISQKLLDAEMSDYQVGQQYYILSSSWLQRWSYYYEGVKETLEDNFKSTKLIKRRTVPASGRRRASFNRSSNSHQRDTTVNDSAWIFEKPTLITFDDIEGEYRGQIKPNIMKQNEIRVIPEELWEMFRKKMQATNQFKRTAISMADLELYPKNIFFLKADINGLIVDNSFKNISMPLKAKVRDLSDKDEQKNSLKRPQKFYFVKNFEQISWFEVKENTALAMCSEHTRFFVVQACDRNNFVENYARRGKKLQNLTYGDKIYSYFSFNKTIMPAIILRNPARNKYLIHYIGFNFRYESEIGLEQISLEQESLLQAIKTSRGDMATKLLENDTSFKGIANIGNTCFINSIIQCLISSPILEKFLVSQKFDERKQPVLYQIAEMAKLLLSHKKASPIKLKKTIDLELQIFSGNDQHDAQQFLTFLLQRLNKQIKKPSSKEESVIEYLLEGKLETSVECKSCQNVNKIQQKVSIISLPIPEPEYNTYSITVFPIYDSRIKKIVLRLHRLSKIKDYLQGFEERLGRSVSEYFFVESEMGVHKRLRHDILEPQNQNLILLDVNLTPHMQVHCFEKFKKHEFVEINEENKKQAKQSYYFDYYDEEMKEWLYGRYLDGRRKIQVMNSNNMVRSFSFKPKMEANLKPLGSQTNLLIHKRIIFRKYNEFLKKMDNFGIQYLVYFCKEITYRQLQRLVSLVSNNFVASANRMRQSQKPYHIKICELGKQKCLYCEEPEHSAQQKQYRKCCKLTDEERDTPIMWLAGEKNYIIYIDWLDIEQYNIGFEGFIEMDKASVYDQNSRDKEKVDIEQCLKLSQKPENVEMQCDKCKQSQQSKAEILKYVPNIMILHMKEFRVSASGHLQKMDVNLKWIEFLDISNYSIGQKGTVYELYAYVRHTGTSQSGHYTCAAKRKHPYENKKIWVNFDDDLTSILDKEQKNIDSAYLLFFKRVDMPTSAFINFTDF